MGLHTRLSAALTVGLLILVLNAYAVVTGHWTWSFDFEPLAVPDTAADLRVDRLPSGAG